MYYCIQAVIIETTQDGKITRQVPTFYLHSTVQMIQNEKDAEKIAKDILSIALKPNCEVHAFAVPIG
jgi:hypothetical protein